MILEVKHMRTITDNEISKLQNYLELIRLAGGWSRASFSELLGITKQTLINLEKKYRHPDNSRLRSRRESGQ